MLNMIADYFTYWAISYPFFDDTAYSPMTPAINRGGWMPEFGPFNTSVIVVLIAFGVTWFVFTRTTAGIAHNKQTRPYPYRIMPWILEKSFQLLNG